MVDEGRYCIDIPDQVQAVRAALAKVETEMPARPPGPLRGERHRLRRQGRTAQEGRPN
jgi:hypothetical protein